MPEKKSKQPEKSGEPAIIIAFLLDETGSMGVVRDVTISAFNEYIVTVAQDHPQALLSLRTFSSQKYDKVTQLTPLAHSPRLSHDNYQPSGGTPLYDAIARLVRETESDAKPFDPVPEVLFVILTDGEENASQEFNRDRIFALISKKSEEGWTFVYLGANQDAWKVGASIGVPVASSMSFNANAEEIPSFLRKTGEVTNRHVSSRLYERGISINSAPKRQDFFTEQDAKDLGKKPPKDPKA